jgi:hypothetical protein
MHSVDGHFAIRQGDWKLLFHGGSGGWSEPQRRPEGAPKWQLYNLKDDIGEQKNLFEKHPEISEKLHALMLDYIKQGRSTPGAEQKNAVPVVLEKPDRIRKKK